MEENINAHNIRCAAGGAHLPVVYTCTPPLVSTGFFITATSMIHIHVEFCRRAGVYYKYYPVLPTCSQADDDGSTFWFWSGENSDAAGNAGASPPTAF